MTVIATLVLISAVPQTHAASPVGDQQERYEAFEEKLQAEDFKAAEKLLQEWQKKSPDDAELAVGWANLYHRRGSQAVSLYAGPRDDEGVAPGMGTAIAVTTTNSEEVVGFLDTRPRYRDDALTRSLAILNDALTTYPQRTDIWMGAVHTLLLNADNDAAYAKLQDWVAYAKKNPTKLTTRYGKPLEQKASEFIPEKLHSYALRGYDQETTAGSDFMLRVARLAQKEYPKHTYGYNDEAAYHSERRDDAKVLDTLLRAHKVQPDDAIITLNIGATYKNLGNLKKAREYYNLTINHTKDANLKADARAELEALDEIKQP